MSLNALSIAGYDPSGGAGVLADVRTFNWYGIYGAAVITAITFQDTHKVHGHMPLRGEDVKAQMEALLEDMDFAAAKIGMLANAEIVRVVADLLERYRVRNVVLDPVLLSSSGAPLLDSEGVEALLKVLLPSVKIITPNVPEAEALTGVAIRSPEDMEMAARRLLGYGAEAVLIKGGHLEGEPVDVLRVRGDDGDRTYRFLGTRVSKDVHGTGCVLSSSIASLLAMGHDVATAVSLAISDIREDLRSRTLKVGGGRLVIFRNPTVKYTP
ncbi:MAG: bifunctional hydroxymethylpyrimidine kinase/phosphomethylpyrimidine kinase [Thermotogae bacterium]|nr:bifunctional hydroxymethylpyrimidine kinase/phosphomethylpyrimidine kinase [Thermotogota bacterium]